MATLTLGSSTSDRAFNFQAKINGVVFDFTLTWNERDAHWYLDLNDADGAPIRSGVKVVVDWPLLKGCVDARRPVGDVVALDTDGAGDPLITDLGGRVLFLYNEA